MKDQEFLESLDRLEYAGAIKVEDAPLVTEGPREMPDHEAHYILFRISAAQDKIASVDANAKTMKSDARVDLKTFLGGFDRLPRLLEWRALNLKSLPKNRKTITTLAGSIGSETVHAKLQVGDKGLALEWCRKHCPEAIVESIEGDKLPKPEKKPNEHGEPVWVAPEGSGLLTVPEVEELKVNGKMLRVLLEGPKNAAKARGEEE